MVRQEIIKLVEKATGLKDIYLEKPENPEHGDYSTNIALKLKKNPQEIVKKLKSPLLEKIEAAGPGFINFFLSKDYLQKQVGEILQRGEKFGQLKVGKSQKVNVEFISANPTGPITLGNGRGGFWGDCLSNVLEKAGFKVSREYYINDRGAQIIKLGHSILGNEQAVYKGEYVDELRKRLKPTLSDTADEIGAKAAKIILEDMIKPAVKKMGIKFDSWVSERKLHEKKETSKALDFLRKKNLVYEEEGALWFKSSQFGDDKDRVLIKENGQATYLLSDIAYLKDKFARGFKKLFFFWGADHYGYIGRVKAVAEALGAKKEDIVILILQLVRLIAKGKEIRMSKRSGIYVTIEELIDDVGLDVARFLFLARSLETHLNFDLDLAREQSEKNPVYYVQYAHARICSILKKIKNQNSKAEPRASEARREMNTKYSATIKIISQISKLLNHPSELSLIKQLIRFPEIVEDTAKDCQVQRIPQYAVDLAKFFHQFYRDCQVISADKKLTKARMSLISAAKVVLGNTLNLLGISASEKM